MAVNTARLLGLRTTDGTINAVDYKTGKKNCGSSGRSASASTSYLTVGAGDFQLQVGGRTEAVINGLFNGCTTESPSGAVISASTAGSGGDPGRCQLSLPARAEASLITKGTGVSCTWSSSGMFAELFANGAGTARLSPSGRVSLDLDQPGSATLTLTANDSPTRHNFEVTTENSDSIGLELTDEGLKITGSDLSGTRVAAYDSEEDGETVDFTTEEPSVLVADRDQKLEVLTDKDGDGEYETPLEPSEPSEEPLSFTDVPQDAYFYKAVRWAVSQGITSGTSATTFSPSQFCTRGQIVTFLWNAAGRPEPKSFANPFADVKQGSYYYKAALWAVENKITSGTSADRFSPNRPCTRAQAMTFLWCAAGRPEGAGGSAFTDVPSGSYYEKAVDWAVANKISSGTSASTFGPQKTCTRAQIVTFLYMAR